MNNDRKKIISAHKEIVEVLSYLGRDHVRGEVRSTHIGKILSLLQQWKTGRWQETLSRLALRVEMSKRNIRENYIEGLVAEGIILISRASEDMFWRWQGLPEPKEEVKQPDE